MTTLGERVPTALPLERATIDAQVAYFSPTAARQLVRAALAGSAEATLRAAEAAVTTLVIRAAWSARTVLVLEVDVTDERVTAAVDRHPPGRYLPAPVSVRVRSRTEAGLERASAHPAGSSEGRTSPTRRVWIAL